MDGDEADRAAALEARLVDAFWRELASSPTENSAASVPAQASLTPRVSLQSSPRRMPSAHEPSAASAMRISKARMK